MRKTMMEFIVIVILIFLAGCSGCKNNIDEPVEMIEEKTKESTGYSEPIDIGETKEAENKSIVFKIDDTIIDVFWMDNDSTKALMELAKDGLVINMTMYGGFEQVGSIGVVLPANDERIETIAGDICLYQSNQLVIFYGSNTWEYTKLGHINMSKLELASLLGDSDVVITIKTK